MRIRYDVLKEFADLTAQGRFSIPIARTFALDEWKTALSVSERPAGAGKTHPSALIPSPDDPG